MLASSKIQPIIPIFFFIPLLNSQIRAENDPEYPLEIPSLLTTSEIAEEIMNQNLNSNCTNLRAFFNSETFQEVEKILNMTVYSTEVNENREEYHSRIKRCSEMERQNRIVKEFERQAKKKELINNKKSGSHSRQKNSKNSNILQTAIKDAITQHNVDQDTSSDDILRRNLAQAMTDATSMETYSRTYRTLPSNPKLFTDPLPNTSTEKNEYSSDLIEKKSKMSKKEQHNIEDFSQRSIIPQDSKLTTKCSENGRNTKKGPLKSLLEQIKYIMQGGALKNSENINSFDSKEKSSSTNATSEEDSIEYEPVTPHKFFNNFDHIKTSNQRSGNEKDNVTKALGSSSAANSEIIRGMHEETKKQLQAKIEDLMQVRKKLLEIVMMMNSAKNQTKINTLAVKSIKKMEGTNENEILSGKNSKNNSNFKTTNRNVKTDARSETNSGSKYGVNMFPKNVTSPTPKLLNKIKDSKASSKESRKRPSTNSKNSTINAISKNKLHEKNATIFLKTDHTLNQIEPLGHHATRFSSSESPISELQFPDHYQHSKIHLSGTDSSQNRDHKNTSFTTRSKSIEIRDKDGRASSNSEDEQQRVQDVTQKTVSTTSTKLKHDFPKITLSAKPSANSMLNLYTEPTSNEESTAVKDPTRILEIDHDKTTGISSSTMESLEYVQTKPASEKNTTLELNFQTEENIENLLRENERDVTENENKSMKDNKTVINSMAKHQKISTQHSTTPILSLVKFEHLPETTSKITELSQISNSQLFHQQNVSNGPTSSHILFLKENEPKVLAQTSTVDLNKATTPLYDEFSKEPLSIRHSGVGTSLQTSNNGKDHSETLDSSSATFYLTEVTTPHHSHQQEMHFQKTAELKKFDVKNNLDNQSTHYNTEEPSVMVDQSHSDMNINPQSFQLSKTTETITKPTSISKEITTPTTSHQNEILSKTTPTLISANLSDASTGESIIRSQEKFIPSENSHFDEITKSVSPSNKEHALEWSDLKKQAFRQYEKSSEGSISHLNKNFSKITTDQPTPLEQEIDSKDPITTETYQLNRNLMSQSSDEDEVSSELVGKSKQSVSTEIHRVDHPSTIPKPLISPLLEKFKHQLDDKLEEIRRNITSRKQKLNKMSTPQPLHLHDYIFSTPILSHKSQSVGSIPSSNHHHSYNPPHFKETSTHQVKPYHHLDKSTLSPHYLDKISTIQPFHSIEKSLNGVIIPSQPHTKNHMPILPHSEPPYSEKYSTLQPSHLNKKFINGITSPAALHKENHIIPNGVHNQMDLLHQDKISTFQPLHLIEKSKNGVFLPPTTHTENHIISHLVYPQTESLHQDKFSTLQPLHLIEKSTNEVENYKVAHTGHHHHEESIHYDKLPAPQLSHPIEKVHTRMEILQQNELSTLHPPHSIGKSLNGKDNHMTLPGHHLHQESLHHDKLPSAEPSHPSERVHPHMESLHQDKLSTLHPLHSIGKSSDGIENHMTLPGHYLHQESLHHDKLPTDQPSYTSERVQPNMKTLHQDKLSTLHPSHSIENEKSLNEIDNHIIHQFGHHQQHGATSPIKPQSEKIPQSVHSHTQPLYQDKLSTLNEIDNHIIHQFGHHQQHGATSPIKPQSEKIPQSIHSHTQPLYQDKLSTLQPSQSIEGFMDGEALPIKPHIMNHVIPQPDHKHMESQHQHKLSTIQPDPPFKRKSYEAPYQITTPQSSHQLEKSVKEIASSIKSHTESYIIPESVHHHYHLQLTDFEKTATHQPSHAHETFLKKIRSQTFHDENVPNSHAVHSHSHQKHSTEISAPQPSHLHEDISKGYTPSMEKHTEGHSILPPLPHHHNHHPDTPYFGSSHTFQPLHSTEMSLNKITPPEKSPKQIHSIFEQFHHPEKSSAQSHLTPPPFHSLINQAKTLHQNNTWTVLKEMERLEKMKIEEIKNLQKKYYDAVHELQRNNLPPSTESDSDLLHKQQNTKTYITNSTSTHPHNIHNHTSTHLHNSHNYDTQGRLASEQDIESHNSFHITKPYSTSARTYTTLKNYDENATFQDDEEIVEKIPFPLPPVNPNENWKYVKKLDKYYEKQKKFTTSKPSTIIRPPISPTPQPKITPRPSVIPPSTIAPTSAPPRMRPVKPSRNETAPRRQPTSTAAPETRKPPPPVNYNINSTINRNYNITINLVTPDSAPRENGEYEDEPENNEPNSMDETNPFTNLARPTVSIKTENKEEATGDFDSSPHPSLPRQLPPQPSNSSNLPPANETLSFSNSTISGRSNQPTSFQRTEIDPYEESSVFENKDAILQTPIPTAPKLPDTSSPSATTTPYQEIISNLKSITKKVQSQSRFELEDHPTTQPSTTFTSDNKTDSTLSHTPCSNVNFTQRGCNNIIIIPNKTEEIMEILRLLNVVNPNDQASTPLPPTFLSPKSASSEPESYADLFSDIKSLLESVKKSKLTQSEKTELRKSIGDLLTALKQRRSNEYTRLYLSKVNPMVGDSRDSIQAITQINEYIELLELMLVYLARDPDRLLDENKDARFDNFESSYPKDDPQRRLIEDQFYYVHPKILNEFIDVYKRYSKDETYYGKPIWQFSQENDPSRRVSRHRSLGSSLSNLFHLKDLIPALTYDRSPMYGPGIQYADYQN